MITAAEVRRYIVELTTKQKRRAELRRVVGDVRRGKPVTGGVSALELRTHKLEEGSDD